jgi:GTP cyclohydrolase I
MSNIELAHPRLPSGLPWVDTKRIEAAIHELLLAIGEDPERSGLKDTPARVARYWQEFIEYDAGSMTTFHSQDVADEMVVVSGMRVYSMCEHHLLPFYTDVSVGYMAQHRILGLSKFARIAHKHAHKLQLQEQLVKQIADEVIEVTESQDVAVIGTGEHSCMISRGIKTPGRMTSSSIRGRFKDVAMRQEFLALIQR